MREARAGRLGRRSRSGCPSRGAIGASTEKASHSRGRRGRGCRPCRTECTSYVVTRRFVHAPVGRSLCSGGKQQQTGQQQVCIAGDVAAWCVCIRRSTGLVMIIDIAAYHRNEVDVPTPRFGGAPRFQQCNSYEGETVGTFPAGRVDLAHGLSTLCLGSRRGLSSFPGTLCSFPAPSIRSINLSHHDHAAVLSR